MTVSFETVVGQFKSKTDFDKYMTQCQSAFDLKVYRVNTMSIQQARNCYKSLQEKYSQGVYKQLQRGWYENERRLFIWFIVCYTRLCGSKCLQKQEKWQQISLIFFNKDWKLLKYQYMTILKRPGRVQWTVEQDQVLTDVYGKHDRGEWNQIAKELFFSGYSKHFKSPKHCRERWNNHLNKQIKKQAWNDEEDLKMLLLVKQNGKKWSLVSKLFGQSRTEHQIKNRYNSLVLNKTTKKQSQHEEKQIVNELVQSLQKSNQSSKFSFFNNIIVIKQEQKPSPLPVKNSFQSNNSIEKGEYVSAGGTALVFCGNKTLEKSVTAAIEDKLFGSNHFMSEIKNDNFWMDKSIVHTPGHHFLEDSYNIFDKKIADFQFKLSQKGSFERSEIAVSMQFLRVPGSIMSQQFKILSSSNSDLKTGLNYEFSNDIKQI